MKEAKRYHRNPFLEKKELGERKKYNEVERTLKLVDRSEPGMEKTLSVDKYYKVSNVKYDDSKFVKCFHKFFLVLKDFSPADCKLISFIFEGLKINQHMIRLNERDIDYININRTSFFNCIRKFIDKGIIARSHDNNVYFINTDIFCNGDVKKMKEDNSKMVVREKIVRNTKKEDCVIYKDGELVDD